jgi:hypothetical protein
LAGFEVIIVGHFFSDHRGNDGRVAATRKMRLRYLPLIVLAFPVFLAGLLLACHADRRESFYPFLSDAKRTAPLIVGGFLIFFLELRAPFTLTRIQRLKLLKLNKILRTPAFRSSNQQR